MKITYNGKTYTYDEWHQEIAREAEAGKKMVPRLRTL